MPIASTQGCLLMKPTTQGFKFQIHVAILSAICIEQISHIRLYYVAGSTNIIQRDAQSLMLRYPLQFMQLRSSLVIIPFELSSTAVVESESVKVLELSQLYVIASILKNSYVETAWTIWAHLSNAKVHCLTLFQTPRILPHWYPPFNFLDSLDSLHSLDSPAKRLEHLHPAAYLTICSCHRIPF